MEENNLFSDCGIQLLDVLNDFTRAYDEGKQVATLYLDIKKAFDTVPHRRLLHNLEKYGISGDIIIWIKHFLFDRKQRVVLKNDVSSWKEVTSEIP